MAEYNEGISTAGRQEILIRKTISDVVYVRVTSAPPYEESYLGYIELAVSFGEESGQRHYSICGQKLFGNAVAICPPFESRVAQGNYSVIAWWRRSGVTWNCNSF